MNEMENGRAHRARMLAQGMGSAGENGDGLVEKVAELLAKYPVGIWAVYVRRSHVTQLAERGTANYLLYQEELYSRLMQIGPPAGRIMLLESDTGKSASLTRREREDLNTLYDALAAEDPAKRVVVIVAVDIARLHRNANLSEPVEFVNRMGILQAGTPQASVLFHDTTKFAVLDMGTDGGQEEYIRLAQLAARERKEIRRRTVFGRIQAVENDAWSGQQTALGWRGESKRASWETEDGQARSAREYIYWPHADVKLAIMREALSPNIETLYQLHGHLLKNKDHFTFPPFDASVRNEAYRHSVLRRCGVLDPMVLGGTRPPRPDETYFPSEKALENILLDALAIGDVRFGSGNRGGAHKLKGARQRAKRDKHAVDTLISENRPLIRVDPKLAICRTEEEIAMFWELARKFSPIDLEASRATGYTEEPPNPNRKKPKRGRPPESGTVASPWAGVIWCVRHGVDENGDFVRVRRMWRRAGQIACEAQKQVHRLKTACAVVTGLEEVFARHLLGTVSRLLAEDDGMIERMQHERDDAKARVAHLDVEHAEMVVKVDKLNKRLARLTATAEDDDAAEEEGLAFRQEFIKPLRSAIAANRREADAAREATLHTPTSSSAEEIRAELRQLVHEWSSYPLERQREIVRAFVESIKVLVPDGTGAVVIEWCWSPRAIVATGGEPLVDVLVSWKSTNRDHRSWTEAEDDALRRLWPASSGADRDVILAALQPGRNYSAIQTRTEQLGVRNPGRATAWRTAWRAWEHTWGERNPAVLYLQVIGFPNATGFIRATTHLMADTDEWERSGIRARLVNRAQQPYPLPSETDEHGVQVPEAPARYTSTGIARASTISESAREEGEGDAVAVRNRQPAETVRVGTTDTLLHRHVVGEVARLAQYADWKARDPLAGEHEEGAEGTGEDGEEINRYGYLQNHSRTSG